MEYETVKQKEKKISVKICKGTIWEEVKDKLRELSTQEKKYHKNKLTVDINVKRQFRSPANLNHVKDESWMNRIKWALSRGSKAQDSSQSTKLKQEDKKNRLKETDKGRQVDLANQQSQNVLTQSKRRASALKSKEQASKEQASKEQASKEQASKEHAPEETLKSKKGEKSVQEEAEVKGKTKDWWRSGAGGGDLSGETGSGLKSARQKGNKYEVQIDNRVTVMNPEDSEEEAVEKAKKRQITKDKRSKSKPATAKEKWNQSPLGKKMELTHESTLETIRNLKSSIISLRVVDKKSKSRDKDRPKERNKREDEKRSRSNKEEQDTVKAAKEPAKEPVELEKVKTDSSDLDKKAEQQKKICKEKKEDKDSVKKEEKDSEQGKENGLISSNSTVNLSNLSECIKDWTIPVDKEDGGYSSSCYSGSSCSVDEECCCGCMDNKGSGVTSSSSCSSLEYLRSYSGNLIMCAHGKKPVLSQHIRYLSSCIKL